MEKLMYMIEFIEFWQRGDKNILCTNFFDIPERIVSGRFCLWSLGDSVNPVPRQLPGE